MSAEPGTPHDVARFLAEHRIEGDADGLRVMAWAALRATGNRVREYLATNPTYRPVASPAWACLLLALLDRAESGDDGAGWIITEALALAQLEADE